MHDQGSDLVRGDTQNFLEEPQQFNNISQQIIISDDKQIQINPIDLNFTQRNMDLQKSNQIETKYVFDQKQEQYDNIRLNNTVPSTFSDNDKVILDGLNSKEISILKLSMQSASEINRNLNNFARSNTNENKMSGFKE